MMKRIMQIEENLSHRWGWITSSMIRIIFFTSYESRIQKQITDNMFWVFVHFFRSVLVRNSAIFFVR